MPRALAFPIVPGHGRAAVSALAAARHFGAAGRRRGAATPRHFERRSAARAHSPMRRQPLRFRVGRRSRLVVAVRTRPRGQRTASDRLELLARRRLAHDDAPAGSASGYGTLGDQPFRLAAAGRLARQLCPEGGYRVISDGEIPSQSNPISCDGHTSPDACVRGRFAAVFAFTPGGSGVLCFGG